MNLLSHCWSHVLICVGSPFNLSVSGISIFCGDLLFPARIYLVICTRASSLNCIGPVGGAGASSPPSAPDPDRAPVDILMDSLGVSGVAGLYLGEGEMGLGARGSSRVFLEVFLARFSY